MSIVVKLNDFANKKHCQRVALFEFLLNSLFFSYLLNRNMLSMQVNYLQNSVHPFNSKLSVIFVCFLITVLE